MLAGAAAADRRLRAFLIDLATGESSDVVVSLTERPGGQRAQCSTRAPTASCRSSTATSRVAEEVVTADPDWQAAMARRGLTDVSQDPGLPADRGLVRAAEDERRRMVRVLAFVQAARARPGLGAPGRRHRRLRRPDRAARSSSSSTSSSCRCPPSPATTTTRRCAARCATTLRPIEITQPEGPSFTLDGHLLQLAGLVDAGRLRRPRGPDPAPDQPRRRRPRAAGDLPRVDPRDGRAVRRPAVPVLADLLRHRRVPGRQVRQLAGAGLRLPGRDHLPGRHGHRRLRRSRG